MAAYFIHQNGGSIEILKLIKLIYLSERESYIRYGEPMIGDDLVSMEHGPVVSTTYNHCKREIESEPGGWDEWISERDGNNLALLVDNVVLDELKQLSDADAEIIENIWGNFGGMTASQLRKYTHDHCPEWEEPPPQSSTSIPFSRLLGCVGYSGEVVRELEDRIFAQRKIDSHF